MVSLWAKLRRTSHQSHAASECSVDSETTALCCAQLQGLCETFRLARGKFQVWDSVWKAAIHQTKQRNYTCFPPRSNQTTQSKRTNWDKRWISVCFPARGWNVAQLANLSCIIRKANTTLNSPFVVSGRITIIPWNVWPPEDVAWPNRQHYRKWQKSLTRTPGSEINQAQRIQSPWRIHCKCPNKYLELELKAARLRLAKCKSAVTFRRTVSTNLLLHCNGT